MARPLRIEYEGAFYHVMNRGNARHPIFETPAHYKIFLDLLSESIQLWEIKIHAFSLLPNHYHLLIETPLANISRAMRHINGVYTQRFNKNRQSDGHIFRGRYKAILVEEDAYLVELIRYIHLNPVKAGLATAPEKHAWTSHADYLTDGKRNWLSKSRILSYFGKRKNLARRKFHEFVMAGVPEDLEKKLDGKKWPSVLSSENFEEWVKWNFVKDIDDGEIQYEELHDRQVSAQKLQKIVCEALDTKWKALTGPSTLSDRRKRVVAIRLYRQYLKLTYGELEKIFNLKAPRISRIMQSEGDISPDMLEYIDFALTK